MFSIALVVTRQKHFWLEKKRETYSGELGYIENISPVQIIQELRTRHQKEIHKEEIVSNNERKQSRNHNDDGREETNSIVTVFFPSRYPHHRLGLVAVSDDTIVAHPHNDEDARLCRPPVDNVWSSNRSIRCVDSHSFITVAAAAAATTSLALPHDLDGDGSKEEATTTRIDRRGRQEYYLECESTTEATTRGRGGGRGGCRVRFFYYPSGCGILGSKLCGLIRMTPTTIL